MIDTVTFSTFDNVLDAAARLQGHAHRTPVLLSRTPHTRVAVPHTQ